jgi:hypothetical protein
MKLMGRERRHRATGCNDLFKLRRNSEQHQTAHSPAISAKWLDVDIAHSPFAIILARSALSNLGPLAHMLQARVIPPLTSDLYLLTPLACDPPQMPQLESV